MTTKDKIAALRTLMTKHGFTAYIIPPTDPHQSEYIADHWKVLPWLSGFTGSAGTLLVTQDFAGLWTDSRYFIQAEKELAGSGIELVRLKIPHSPEYIDWIKNNLKQGDIVGINGKVFSESLVRTLKKGIADKGIRINCGLDIPGMLWKNRPPMSNNRVYEHEQIYAGTSRREKIQMVREQMSKKSIDYHLLTSLDDIAWLFNLRGTDIDYNPLFIAYALLSSDNVTIFINEQKLSSEVKQSLLQDSVIIQPYESIDKILSTLTLGSDVLFTSTKTSHYLTLNIPVHCKKIDDVSIPTRLKAIKGKAEIANIRNAMIKDGVALVKFYRWLEENIGKEAITEVTIDEKLTSLRSHQKNYIGNSFATIAGYKDHGAIVHYTANDQTAYTLKPEGILLLDSGAHYLDGTTDITRTTFLGDKPSEEEIRDYTMVLKGHIQLSMVKFPEGTKGYHLDILARKTLWEQCQNYGHGTGHGVGYFLNVHEGPQGITPNAVVKANLEPGMIQSNEPGFYKEGKYGIRLENLIMVKEYQESEYGKFYEFESLTLFPYETKLIDPTFLEEKEKDWLNKYHNKVFENLSGKLNKEENQWLLEKTKKLT